jgi:hypothetical protein
MTQSVDQDRSQVAAPEEAVQTFHCAYHPDRETVLRCNRCGQPICFECAVRTPVGYRCKVCVRQQQSVYYNGRPGDPVIAALVGLILGGIVGALAYLFLGILGIFSLILAFFIGPAVGGMIAEGVRQSVGRRRSRNLNIIALVAAVLGILVGIAVLIAPAAGGSFMVALGRLPLVAIRRWDLALFTVLVASTIYWRLR